MSQARIHTHKRLFVVGIVILVVVVGAVAGLWFTRSSHKAGNSSTSKTANSQALSTGKGEANVALQNTATQAAQASGPAAGQKVYDQQLQKTTNSADQAQIYLLKSALAGSTAGGNDQAAALQYAYDAEKASPSTGTAVTIAQLEEQAGNKANAIKYYNLYLSRVTDAEKNVDQGDFEYYSAHVKQLEGQQ